jgi:ubiquinone biosynthesis accessory factor UbiK
MIDPKKCTPQFFDTLAQKLSSVLPDSVHNLKQDMEKNFKAILMSAFEKMDLVTREEFDAQSKVLERTRTKLEELSAKISEIEKNK